MLVTPIAEMSARNLVVIPPSMEQRSDDGQDVYDEADNVIKAKEHKGDFKEP